MWPRSWSGPAKDGDGESGPGIPDYTATSGTLTFDPGETTKTVTVALANDDDVEDLESYTVELSNEKRGGVTDGDVTISDSVGDAFIADDDSLTISISDAVLLTATEGSGATSRTSRC